jgi:hypothetical protein
MRATDVSLLAAVVGVLSGCGGPTKAQVHQAFQRENPGCTVADVYVTEGDGSAVYFTIKYRDPASQTDRRACWQYLNSGKEGWHLNHKDSVAEPAPPGYCR